MIYDLVIKGGTLVTPSGTSVADLAISKGRIVAHGRGFTGRQEIDADGRLVLPGVIDAHTHMALPVGGTRSSDDFHSGTVAAACGGVTTIIDFTVGARDLSLPAAVEERLITAQKAVIDYALHAELVGWTAERVGEIFAVAKAGVRSFGEIFTTYSESGRRTSLGDLQVALTAIRKISGTAMVHAEADELVHPEEGPYPPARPALAEAVAIAQVGVIAAHTGCCTCIAHVSSAPGLAALFAAQKQGAPILGETCPQYLLLDEQVYAREDGHLFSVVPPLRREEDQQALWSALETGGLALLSTDHCPFTRAQKEVGKDDPTRLPAGLPGIETFLPLIYSAGVDKGRLPLTALPRLLSEGPAKTYGLYPQKGTLAIGADADLVVFDPTAKWTIHAERLHMAIDFSPYEGMAMCGAVETTISRGMIIYAKGSFQGEAGWGRFITR